MVCLYLTTIVSLLDYEVPSETKCYWVLDVWCTLGVPLQWNMVYLSYLNIHHTLKATSGVEVLFEFLIYPREHHYNNIVPT